MKTSVKDTAISEYDTAVSANTTAQTNLSTSQTAADAAAAILVTEVDEKSVTQAALDAAQTDWNAAIDTSDLKKGVFDAATLVSDASYTDWQASVADLAQKLEIRNTLEPLQHQIDRLIIPSEYQLMDSSPIIPTNFEITAAHIDRVSGDLTINYSAPSGVGVFSENHSVTIKDHLIDPIDLISIDIDGDRTLETFEVAQEFIAGTDANSLVIGSHDIAGETLIGGGGDDWFIANAGDDIILGGGGADVIDGGAGDDMIDGGEGKDRIQYTGGASGVNVDLASGASAYNAAVIANTATQASLVAAQSLADQADSYLTAITTAKTNADNDYNAAATVEANAMASVLVAEETVISAGTALTEKVDAQDIANANYQTTLAGNVIALDNLSAAQVTADEAASLLVGAEVGTTSWVFDGNARVIANINEPETNISREIMFSTTVGGGIFFVDPGGHDRHLIIQSDGNIYSRVWSNETIRSTGLNLLDGEVHRLLFTLGDNGTNIYIDGNLVAHGSKEISAFNWSSRINLGYSPDAGYFNGKILSYKQWDQEFSAEQAAAVTDELPDPEHVLLVNENLSDTGSNPISASGISVSGSPTFVNNVETESYDLAHASNEEAQLALIAAGQAAGLASAALSSQAVVRDVAVTEYGLAVATLATAEAALNSAKVFLDEAAGLLLTGSGHTDEATTNYNTAFTANEAAMASLALSQLAAAAASTILTEKTAAKEMGTAIDQFGSTDQLFNIEDIEGTGMDDVMSGDEGANTLTGREGDDILSGNGGNDSIFGQDGDDTLIGGAGDNFIDGGEGLNDIVSFYQSSTGVVVDLHSGAQVVHSDGTDTLANIENVEGTALADNLSGDDGANVLFGKEGDDVISGGLGADQLYGGSGNDHFIYEAGDSTPENRDEIIDFEAGGDGSDGADKIDISSLVNGTFSLHAAGHIFENNDGNTQAKFENTANANTKILQIDADGDAQIDQEIKLTVADNGVLDESDLQGVG
jgi:Ca2+-binding RTX toxin-like protein